jgi:hypothetical protein
MTSPPASAGAPAKPLSPALDTTFKIGLVLKGLDGILEVVEGAGRPGDDHPRAGRDHPRRPAR